MFEFSPFPTSELLHTSFKFNTHTAQRVSWSLKMPCRCWHRYPPSGTHWKDISWCLHGGSLEVVHLRDSDLKALANSLEHRLVLFLADEGDGKTLGTETAGTTNAVQVRIGISRHVVVDGQVDTLNIDTTTEDVSGNADTLVELLELLVPTDTG